MAPPQQEPAAKRAIAFIDGQNLFHQAKEAFGYTFPNYDPLRLAQRLSADRGWNLVGTQFYTGVPDNSDKPFWNKFWNTKLLAMSRAGVAVYSRTLRYRNQSVSLPDGTEYTFLSGNEKGIDVRIALDVFSLAHADRYDVALIFSQDQDLSEVADEIRVIASEHDRWIKIVSAFPVSPAAKNKRGINKTDWIKIDKRTYDACIDPRDYRPRQ